MREFSIIQFEGEPYLHYWCKHCTEECLNQLTADRTRHRECSTCHDLPVLEEKQPIDRVVPSLRWATIATQQFSPPPQSTASEQRSGCPPHMGGGASSTAPEGGSTEPTGNDDGGKPQWRLNDSLATDGGDPDA